MFNIEQLTLNGALTLLTYLQHTHFENEPLNASAIVATLCEMLNQLEANFPGLAKEYGWTQTVSHLETRHDSWQVTRSENKLMLVDRALNHYSASTQKAPNQNDDHVAD